MKTADKNFFENFDYSKNLVLCGPVGVGKTYKALQLLARYRGKSEHEHLWTYKISDAKFKELVASKQMGHKPTNERSYYGYPLEFLLRCEVILFDDIGVTDVTETYLRKLTYMLDERLAKGKKHIFTTNLSEKELKEKLNERIVSRILCNATVLVMTGPDLRKEKTEILKYEQCD